MGVVYLAIDIALDRKVAIKTLPHLTIDRVVRLRREARAMATAPHPNLAMIFGIESWRGAPLLVVEYLDGGTLADRLPGARLPLDEAAALGIVLADVLDRLHASGVLHRDIKPSNIGYTRDGQPKLLDFGIASMLDASGPISAVAPAEGSPTEAKLTGVDQMPGTPLYLCPEAIDGAQPDASFDLWSLGLVLYEAIGGQHPFRAPTVEEVFEKIRTAEIPDLRTVRPGTPAVVASVFTRALSRNPAERPHSAAELRNWLQRLRADLRPT
jgi:serine/threonine-protein kinase